MTNKCLAFSQLGGVHRQRLQGPQPQGRDLAAEEGEGPGDLYSLDPRVRGQTH